MELLTVTEKDGTDYKLYELSGGFNAYTLVNVASKIYSSIQKTNVVLDMANVTELDAAAIGVIMAAHNDSEETGKKLYLLSISSSDLKKRFIKMKLTAIFLQLVLRKNLI